MIVGSAPNVPGSPRCGVADYACCLSQSLREIGVDTEVLAPARWSLREGLSFAGLLRSKRFDIVHLQYPSIGHRSSLLPHMLGPLRAGRRFVVTLHEHSCLPRAQRAANSLFRATACQRVFTTEFEARAFGASGRDPVIPIGSNVPRHPEALPRDETILYFGQIRPGKGIEEFLSLARLANEAHDPVRFTVIGTAPPRWQDYLQALRSNEPAGVKWIEDASAAEVARLMATSMAAYLPFPDGAGLRRGSLIAALSNDLPVITTFGPSTTAELASILILAQSPDEALNRLQKLRNEKIDLRRVEIARNLAERLGWPSIALEHMRLYSSLLSRHSLNNAACTVNIQAGLQLERSPASASVQ